MTIATVRAGHGWINKVPEATLLFWIIKMMSTTVGETGADYLATDLHFGLVGTSLTTGLLLACALLFQLRAKRYLPALYWICVVLVSVFGTLVTDMLSDLAGVPLAFSTTAFSIAMIATFAAWHAREKTLSITAIDSPRRELFYWTVILFTFALGTAAGDWVAEGLSLGYANSALLFGGLIGLVALARYAFKINATACFWVAYVLTRPFGASCGDLLSQPAGNGGLGFGTIATSALFLAVIVSLVSYLSFTQKRLTAQGA
ncbi:putative membrane-anchored protein [Collimonas sp. PA-H2]|uniref:COG4705 family protein n=1 Tax=Collimonas sp. PA-H2 TaxID=1881062 RepID=UPI000BF4593B|nr:hypothetical protein [Collimonas sp. PA-H2]PFH04508.1 putative membrane-anchored protein [Collimonas sp. PA-H2]